MDRRQIQRDRDNERNALPLDAAPETSAGGAAPDLLVLRTAVRRLAVIALKVYDMWASGAGPEDLEIAEDTVKPMLEQLLRDAGYRVKP